MRRALLLVNTSTYFADLYRIALMMRASSRYEPVILFEGSYPTLDEHKDRCRSIGMEWIDAEAPRPAGTRPGTSPIPSLKERIRNKITSFVPGYRSGFLAHFRSSYRYKQNRYEIGLETLHRAQADILVTGGDLIHYNTPMYIKAARTLGIPSVAVPSWMAGHREAAESILHRPEYHVRNATAHAVSRLFPKWVIEYRGKKLFRLPPHEVLALEALGVAPPKPWVLHSGRTDAIAVESESMKHYCVREGLPEEKLIVTGSVANDTLWRTAQDASDTRLKLCRELGLQAAMPLLLTAVPPNHLDDSGGRPQCDFKTYSELLSYWIETISQGGRFQVALSLHPSMRSREFTHLESSLVRIVHAPTETLIPLCDLYVAAVSSTIQWAIACGKPAVNYDVYRFCYTDYDEAPGVLTTREKAEFATWMKRLAEEPSFLAQVRSDQERNAPRWGRLDGKSGERLLNLFDSLKSSASPM